MTGSRDLLTPIWREGGWVLLGQVAAAVAGLIGVRVLTELAAPSV